MATSRRIFQRMGGQWWKFWIHPRLEDSMGDSVLDGGIPKSFQVPKMEGFLYLIVLSGCWFQTVFFHPYLGKWSNLTNIFQMGLKPPTSYSLLFWGMCSPLKPYPSIQLTYIWWGFRSILGTWTFWGMLRFLLENNKVVPNTFFHHEINRKLPLEMATNFWNRFKGLGELNKYNTPSEFTNTAIENTHRVWVDVWILLNHGGFFSNASHVSEFSRGVTYRLFLRNVFYGSA